VDVMVDATAVAVLEKVVFAVCFHGSKALVAVADAAVPES